MCFLFAGSGFANWDPDPSYCSNSGSHFICFAFFLLDPDSPTGIRILATAQIQILISSAFAFPLIDKFW
jgi:hypothetical protein